MGIFDEESKKAEDIAQKHTSDREHEKDVPSNVKKMDRIDSRDVFFYRT